MAALTEQNIIDIVYSLYETDTTGWASTDEEYLAARKYANVAISRWENYDNTTWRELWGTLTDAADGDKSTAAADWIYSCPTNFKRPGSWVRTGSKPQYWEVISPEKAAQIGVDTNYWCWFSGNVKDGFKLNFNPNVTIYDAAADNTIYYEYYKTATTFTTTSSTTEMADPYFIVYYVLYRFLKNDGEDYSDEANQSEDLLENMRTANMSGFHGIPNTIQINGQGFGE